MKKSWNIIEKVIATLLQAWALFYVYSLSSHNTETVRLLSKSAVNYGLLIKAFHLNYLIGVLCFVGGIGLLYDKRWGWVSCIISTLVFTGLMLVSGRNGITTEQNEHMVNSISYLIVAALFIATFILLVQKPFRVKYRPNMLTWLLIAGVIVLVIVDKSVL